MNLKDKDCFIYSHKVDGVILMPFQQPNHSQDMMRVAFVRQYVNLHQCQSDFLEWIKQQECDGNSDMYYYRYVR